MTVRVYHPCAVCLRCAFNGASLHNERAFYSSLSIYLFWYTYNCLDLPLPAPRVPAWSNERLAAEIGVYRAQIQARAVNPSRHFFWGELTSKNAEGVLRI